MTEVTADRSEHATEAAGVVRAFVQRVLRQRQLARLGERLMVVGLPVGCVAAVLLFWSPWLAAAVLGTALLLAAVTVLAGRRPGVEAPIGTDATLRDGLRTWVEVDERGAGDSSMARWLAGDLAVAVDALPAPTVRAALRRRPGRIRYLVPLLVLLVLAWLLRPDFSLPLPGPGGGGGGGGQQGDGGNGGGGSQGKGAGSGSPQQERPDTDPKGAQDPPPKPDEAHDPPPDPGSAPPPSVPPPPPPPAPPGDSDPVEPGPPAPLLSLPDQLEVVVPDFTGDGPTRREEAHRALVGADEPQPQATPSGAGDPRPPDAPPPVDDDFRRAAEKALQSRHVPPAEQRIVRRFFELLQKGGK